MLIKRPTIRDSLPRFAAGILGLGGARAGRLRPLVWTGGAILCAFGLGALLVGTYHVVVDGPQYAVRAYRSSLNWMGSRAVTPRSFNIDINFEDYQWLAFDRKRALDRGRIIQNERSYVPARLEFSDRVVPVKMRLKGDMVDHLEGDKWSFRIRVKGGDAVLGMGAFSIQDPRRSSYLYEWVFHELMRHQGLVAPRYEFVEVSINGRAMGVYALEESFSKEMLEAHGQREGPIVRFDESHLLVRRRPSDADVLFATAVDAFQSRKTSSDPTLDQQFDVARELLEGFRDQRIPLGQAFDLEKTATYFAILDLCSAHHAARWKNIRFYYNPLTSLLEPIPYNAYGGALAAGQARIDPIRHPVGQRVYGHFHVKEWMDAFFADPSFYRSYVAELDRVSRRPFISGFLADIADRLQENVEIIRRDDPEFAFSSQYLFANGRSISAAVRPRMVVRARYDAVPEASGHPRLWIANNLPLMIELDSVVDERSGTRHPFGDDLRLAPRRSTLLEDASVALPAGAVEGFAEFADGDLQLRYRVLGMENELSAPIVASSAEPATNLRRRMAELAERADSIRDHEAFEVDETEKTIAIRGGAWRLHETLYVPAGYVLEAGPGTTLTLGEGADLISYSPLRFEGTREAPVWIRGEDGSGGGLAVLSAGGESVLRHVRFENLGTLADGAWEVTGSVMWYESPVRLVDCHFAGSRSEDQVNLVRSSFRIESSRFDGALSDALDVDFASGSIRGSAFSDAGNDGIDLSGSEVVISDCRIAGAGDKAVSAGEASRVELADLEVIDSRFGVVSKDLSSVQGTGVSIRGGAFAIAAYQKKPMYGPASLTLARASIEGAAEPLLIEKGSWVELNGRRREGTRLGVADAISGAGTR